MADKGERKILSEEEIDDLVESQAGDDKAWEEPIQVIRKQENSLSLPKDLAMRAAFLARLHKEPNTTEWLKRIIAERIELEESAFLDFKRTLASHRRA
ncbi:MAG: hypothetical protein JST85_02430 [Acidobacteria bacterium]|nr:hypothetical protein [Acidobacteriota bacterium]